MCTEDSSSHNLDLFLQGKSCSLETRSRTFKRVDGVPNIHMQAASSICQNAGPSRAGAKVHLNKLCADMPMLASG